MKRRERMEGLYENSLLEKPKLFYGSFVCSSTLQRAGGRAHMDMNGSINKHG